MAAILVTGGAGFIGSHTCKALAAEGHTTEAPLQIGARVIQTRGAVQSLRCNLAKGGENLSRMGQRSLDVLEVHRPATVAEIYKCLQSRS